METVVRVRGSRRAVHAALGKIAGAAAGTQSQATLAQRALMCRLGLTILGRIRKAFVTKAAGGIDEAGDQWAPHSPITTAHRNYKKEHGRRVSFSMFLRKVQADRSIMTRYGKPDVPLLRDVGLLLNSLSPGIDPGMAQTVPNVRHQVFRIGRGEVIVGTNRKGAKDNHEGKPLENLPQRRLWPSPAKWPSTWWQDMLEQSRQGVIDIVVWFLQRV